MLKKEVMEKLKDEYEINIGQHTGRTIVFGEGNLDAKIMLIGEAPGEQEEKQKRPFVGQAGRNLQEFLDILRLKREDIYITNVVKFRPYKVNEKTGRKSNRAPDRNEIDLWGRFLLREMDVVSPEVIVTLGNVPLKFILGSDKTIGECHGNSYPVSAGSEGRNQYVFPLYHPASIIYRKELKSVYRMDLEKLRDFMTKNSII